jgi:hypothetical protein
MKLYSTIALEPEPVPPYPAPVPIPLPTPLPEPLPEPRPMPLPAAWARTEERPVLIVFLGAHAHRKLTIARVRPGLDDAVLHTLPAGQPGTESRATHRRIAEHLAAGNRVLVDTGNGSRASRRALLDAAALHWAPTLAVLCGTDAATRATELSAEGWHAVLLTR